MTQYLSDGAHFSHANVLGSETQTTDWTGDGGQAAILYYPWGQVWQNPSGKYGSSFLQDFASLTLYVTSTDGYVPPFRYYIPEKGRWSTPDPLAGTISNPQSLNRYAYVLNNPTSLVDPLGLGVQPYSPPPNPCPNGMWNNGVYLQRQPGSAAVCRCVRKPKPQNTGR